MPTNNATSHEHQVDANAGGCAITLNINGQGRALTVEPRLTLLDALRERLLLTGTKKGCDHGQCGACTVHINGERTLSCLTLAVMQQGHRITTIEGLAEAGALHHHRRRGQASCKFPA